MRRIAAVAALALLLAGCTEDDPSTVAVPRTTTTAAAAPAGSSPSTPAAPQGPVAVRLQEVGEFENPVNFAAPGDGNLYVVEQQGTIRAIRDGRRVEAPVLDISERIRSGGEQGLLGLAFSPDRTHLYVNYTDRDGDTRIVEFAFDGTVADKGSARELLQVDQPFANHNGGHLVMRDGMLWIALGDGGGGGDPQNRAQNKDDLLGKLLRIDPKPSAGKQYGIPPDNPFVGQRDARPEVWAYGLRNPWRFTFDRENGDLWVADVGQNAVEEVNRVPGTSRGGENYGWRIREGSRPYIPGLPKPPGAIDPVHDYSHDDGGCSVTGGHVYRGSAIPSLQGAYLFGDYCIGQVMAFRDGKATPLGIEVSQLTSFGEDTDGELYVLSAGDGRVSRLVPAS